MKGTVSDLSLIYIQYFQLLVSGDYIGFILTFLLKGWDRNFKTKDWVSSATAHSQIFLFFHNLSYFCSFTVGSHIKRQNCQLNYFLGIGKFISRTKFLFYFGLLFFIPRAIHLKLETTRKTVYFTQTTDTSYNNRNNLFLSVIRLLKWYITQRNLLH